jgi:hypothetical protein
MAKTIFSAGEINILITEAHTDAAAKAAEGFAITGSRFAPSRMSSQPHDAAPFAFLKLHGFFGFFIRPDQSDRLIAKRNGVRNFALHL